MDEWRRRADELGGILGNALGGTKRATGGPIRGVAFGANSIAIGGNVGTVNLHISVAGETTIGALEKAKLKGMVGRIVQLEGAGGADHRAVYAQLQTTFRIATLRDLPRADYAMAVQFLQAWIQRLQAAKPKR